MKKLTAIAVRQAKPREKDWKLSDGHGLFLLIKVNGAKYWRMKYRFGGKEKLLSIGVYPEYSLEEARDIADEARRTLRKDKKDPSAEKQAEKLNRLRVSENSFQSIARE